MPVVVRDGDAFAAAQKHVQPVVKLDDGKLPRRGRRGRRRRRVEQHGDWKFVGPREDANVHRPQLALQPHERGQRPRPWHSDARNADYRITRDTGEQSAFSVAVPPGGGRLVSDGDVERLQYARWSPPRRVVFHAPSARLIFTIA